jgi:hypothetical protein
MYKRSGVNVSEVKASHLVYISDPDAVARVIETARRRDQALSRHRLDKNTTRQLG